MKSHKLFFYKTQSSFHGDVILRSTFQPVGKKRNNNNNNNNNNENDDDDDDDNDNDDDNNNFI